MCNVSVGHKFISQVYKACARGFGGFVGGGVAETEHQDHIGSFYFLFSTFSHVTALGTVCAFQKTLTPPPPFPFLFFLCTFIWPCLYLMLNYAGTLHPDDVIWANNNF